MGRTIAWRSRSTPEVDTFLSQVSTCGLLLMQQPGPTSFVLKDPSTNKKFKVSIGDAHQCSCRGAASELCLHILFVLSRVFRVPADNPLVWQRSLLEAEVDQLIRGHISKVNQRRRRQGGGNGPQDPTAECGPDGRLVVPRRPVEEDDTCPICCDDIHEDRALVYCRFGCGNNIHSACFKQYATHNSTNPSPLLCPLCREQWGPLGVEGAAHNVACSDCRGPINGDRYKCAFCTSYDLCSSCFQNALIHLQHPFNVSVGPNLPFHPANRPVAPRVAASAPPVAPGAPGVDFVHPWMLRELGPDDYDALLQLDEDVTNTRDEKLLPEQARSLKKHSWTRRNEVMEMCDTCAICMEVFQEGTEVNSLPLCNHFFHVPCAFRWLTECKAVCPIDNHVVPAAAFVRGRDPPTAPPAAAPGPSTMRRRSNTTGGHGGAARDATRGGGPMNPPAAAAAVRARHRFEDARASQRAELAQRNPNLSLTGYCPTQRDLDMLVVGAPAPGGAQPSGGAFSAAVAAHRALPQTRMVLRPTQRLPQMPSIPSTRRQ
ncbi:zinc finger protein, putative [Bodo saltans]|uniref:Zinc finger protein, putative n=1 Tax=Bodo saltans TaxID=75058 RepID=A0A0S4KHN3_BODSA|nr:zinc finger protein, putative [Bodo saltans]|eukprot:CUI12371.1 zinc finger protein, putative [Bodo saltans]